MLIDGNKWNEKSIQNMQHFLLNHIIPFFWIVLWIQRDSKNVCIAFCCTFSSVRYEMWMNVSGIWEGLSKRMTVCVCVCMKNIDWIECICINVAILVILIEATQYRDDNYLFDWAKCWAAFICSCVSNKMQLLRRTFERQSHNFFCLHWCSNIFRNVFECVRVIFFCSNEIATLLIQNALPACFASTKSHEMRLHLNKEAQNASTQLQF